MERLRWLVANASSQQAQIATIKVLMDKGLAVSEAGGSSLRAASTRSPTPPLFIPEDQPERLASVVGFLAAREPADVVN